MVFFSVKFDIVLTPFSGIHRWQERLGEQKWSYKHQFIHKSKLFLRKALDGRYRLDASTINQNVNLHRKLMKKVKQNEAI
jgi:hypothetical protein